MNMPIDIEGKNHQCTKTAEEKKNSKDSLPFFLPACIILQVIILGHSTILFCTILPLHAVPFLKKALFPSFLPPVEHQYSDLALSINVPCKASLSSIQFLTLFASSSSSFVSAGYGSSLHAYSKRG